MFASLLTYMDNTNTDISFSRREEKAFQLLGDGLTTGEIANLLHLSEGVIETYRSNMLKKVYDDILKLKRQYSNHKPKHHEQENEIHRA